MKLQKYIIFSLMTLTGYGSAYEFAFKAHPASDKQQEIEVTIGLAPDELLYKDSFKISANDPGIVLSKPTSPTSPITFFDKNFNTHKEGYANQVIYAFRAERTEKATLDQPVIHTSFMINTHKEPQQKIITLNFTPEIAVSGTPSTQVPTAVTQATCAPAEPSLSAGLIETVVSKISTTTSKWKATLSSLFNETGSHWIRLIVALILGILLSLTPCIYPMIPITVGVLQINQTKSALASFAMAASYTLGISLTFAALGLIAAFGSCVFGQLQGSPWFIIPLVVLLTYLGFSMLGFYEMYIPRFLSPKSSNFKGGSYASAFIFGAISGTVASPCLSPGLLLILDYVSTLSVKSSILGYIEGFILLFVFGVGSSLPLLIIGTFSSSAHLMPRAGMWMVEIKKLIGLLLIAMAFYHLSHLERFLPWHILIWLVVITFFAFGVYYLISIAKHDSPAMKIYKYLVGIALIIGACMLALQGYKAIHEHRHGKESGFWSADLIQTLEQAQQQKKNLFVDIGATYCSACKTLDRQILCNERVMLALKKYVPVKIESDIDHDAFQKAKELFGSYIKGFPTYLVVNGQTKEVIKKWNDDLAQLSIDQIVEQLEKLH